MGRTCRVISLPDLTARAWGVLGLGGQSHMQSLLYQSGDYTRQLIRTGVRLHEEGGVYTCL
jgi:hypothetical protein